jgi:outer membrane beta-barrel protein
MIVPLLLAVPTALAAGPNDLGVLADRDVRVVQRQLYDKAGRAEVGAALGLVPFDPWTRAAQLALRANLHRSDSLGVGVQIAGSYAFPTSTWDTLSTPPYNVAVEAYGPLASADATVEWSPVYAKMNASGRILHHDLYVLGGAGVTLEQSVLPSGDRAWCPTVPLGVGARVWLDRATALRLQVRDDLLVQTRAQSGTTALKQNVVLSVGLSRFTGTRP